MPAIVHAARRGREPIARSRRPLIPSSPPPARCGRASLAPSRASGALAARPMHTSRTGFAPIIVAVALSPFTLPKKRRPISAGAADDVMISALFVAWLFRSFGAGRSPGPIRVDDEALHEALEQRRHRVDVGRRSENEGVGSLDLRDQLAHAVAQNAFAGRVAG